MNVATLLSFVVAFALAVLSHGAVRQIALRRVAVPSELRQHLIPKERWELLERHQEAMKLVRGQLAGQLHSAVSSALNVSIENYYAVVVDVGVGTPKQSFSLQIDPFADQLYVIGAGAKYASSSSDTAVTDKSLFQQNASSSYQPSDDADFIDYYDYQDGAVGTDVVQIGPSLSANLSINVASSVSSWMKYNDIDGTLGVSIWRSSNDTPTILEQLLPSLSLPVITTQIKDTDHSYGATGSGVVEFGGLAPSVCQNDWISLDKAGEGSGGYWSAFPSFNVTAISGPASAGNCQNQINANLSVHVVDFPTPLIVSYQVQELIVQASGAQYNSSIGWYTVADVANAKPLTLTLESGKIQLNPSDYLVEYEGTSYLNSYGGYDQHMYLGMWLVLGQQFLRTRCLSQNINTGAWSLASAINGADPAQPSPDDNNNGTNTTTQSTPSSTPSNDGGGNSTVQPTPDSNNNSSGGNSTDDNRGDDDSSDGNGNGGNSTDGGSGGNSTDGGNGSSNSSDGVPTMALKRIGRNMLGVRLFGHL